MRKLIMIGLSLSQLGLMGCAKDGIPVIGLDSKGKEVEFFIPDQKFQTEATKLMTQTAQATLLGVQQQQENTDWMLRSVVLVMGLKFDGGIGPFVKYSANPRFSMILSNAAVAPTP